MLANGAWSAISNVRQARSSSASVTFHTPISSAASRGARAASLVEFRMPGQTPKAGICVNSDEGGAGQKARQILQVWGSETESSSTSSRWGQDCSLNVENRGLNPNLGRKILGRLFTSTYSLALQTWATVAPARTGIDSSTECSERTPRCDRIYWIK